MIQSTRVLSEATIALIVASAAPTLGQRADTTSAQGPRMIGVFDSRSGDPLPGVQVRDAFSGTYALTTPTGTALLGFLTFRGAAALVELRKLGYEAKQVLVNRADTVPITEIMDPVVALAPVVTTERYRIDRDAGTWKSFEQRCQSKAVTCIKQDALEKRPTANLADFLVHADGVTIGACGGGRTRTSECGKIAMRPTVIPPAFCQPTFFVDGFEWSPQAGAPSDLVPNRPAGAPYTPVNVKAVEVYAPDRPRPLRFSGDPTCGVVVIWTK
jgi:hypothetical protein